MSSTIEKDFSTIILSRQELALLKKLRIKPMTLSSKSNDVIHELQTLKFAILKSPRSANDPSPYGLFITDRGKAYLDYLNRKQISISYDLLKWLIPVIISIFALIQSIFNFIVV